MTGRHGELRRASARLAMALLALVVSLAAGLAGPVRPAAAAQLGSMSLGVFDPRDHAPVAGVDVDVFLVATLEDGSLVPQGGFAQVPVALPDPSTGTSGEWAAAAETLKGYATAGGAGIAPVASSTSASDGYARTGRALETGCYLVVPHPVKVGSRSYWFKPSLTYLPSGDGRWDLSMEAKPATMAEGGGRLRVVKRWQDQGQGRPASVTVSIWRDGKLFQTQELSDANDWSYTWEEDEPGHEWTVTENLEAGTGWTVTCERDDQGVFTLVNTNTPPEGPDNPPSHTPGRVPQTGEPWRPTAVLLAGGLALLALGLLGRRGKGTDERP